MEQYKLPLWQLFCHLAVIYCAMTFTSIDYATAIAVYFVTGCLGITVTYHRLLTHKSYETLDIFRKIGTIFGTLGGVGTSIGWVSIHRQHHRYSDKELDDPHTPNRHMGFIHCFYGSMFVEPKIRYVPDLLRDKFQLRVHENYWKINIAYAVALLLIGGVHAWMVFHVFPSFILWTAMGSVNYLGHKYGYRNYPDTREQSKNNWFAGLIAWGEGWHNNHHGDPYNYTFQVKWWEFDMSKWVIKLIRK
jgi:stearoyl-CoA desaturase (delta-9 desaturase)